MAVLYQVTVKIRSTCSSIQIFNVVVSSGQWATAQVNGFTLQ